MIRIHCSESIPDDVCESVLKDTRKEIPDDYRSNVRVRVSLKTVFISDGEKKIAGYVKSQLTQDLEAKLKSEIESGSGEAEAEMKKVYNEELPEAFTVVYD